MKYLGQLYGSSKCLVNQFGLKPCTESTLFTKDLELL